MRDRLARLLYGLAATLLVMAVLMMTVQVALRTFFSAPMSWVEEVVRYAFVWCVYLGTVLAVISDTHIRVTVAIDHLEPRVKVWSDVVSRIVNLVCFAYLAWWGLDLALKYRAAEFYTVPGMPMMLFYASLPLCSAIIVLFLLIPGGVKSDNHAGPRDL